MKKRLIASIIFLIICISATIIFAASNAKFEVNADATTIKPGEEVTFTVKIKDFESQDGIYGVEAVIGYSEDIFEEVSKSNISSPNGWSAYFYNKKMILEGDSPATNNSDLITIKLKVKNDANLVGKTGEVTLSNGVVYNAEESVDLATVSSSVKIGEGSSNQDSTPTPTTKPTATPTVTPNGGSESTPTPSTKPTTKPTASPSQNNGGNQGNLPVTNIDTNTGNSSSSGSSSSGSSSSTANKGTTTSSSSLPKAGIGSTITVLTVIVALIGTISYIKLRKYREI